MEQNDASRKDASSNDHHQEEAVSPGSIARIKEIISNLPEEKGWKALEPFRLYQGFWCFPIFLQGIILAQQRFKPQPADILVCSAPKCGTTWLKALTFAIVTRAHYEDSTSPLLFKGPHRCVPAIEGYFDQNQNIRQPGLPLIATHTPYASLPKSVIDSDCKIVYICRDPKDMFVSNFHFSAKVRAKVRPEENEGVPDLEKAFGLFCEGKSVFGPFWDHILGYWKASLERPGKVLFLKYEDMMRDTEAWVRKLAEFMGFGFTPEEEQKGAVQKIVELCSFERLSNLEVNKNGMQNQHIANQYFFRKGKVGDWKNWLAPDLAERLNKVMTQKFSGSGLTFDSQ